MLGYVSKSFDAAYQTIYNLVQTAVHFADICTSSVCELTS